MMLGEHGVLNGARCLVAAVDKRLYVDLRSRADAKVLIQADHGCYESALAELQPDARFRFVVAAVQSMTAELPAGVELRITSDFSHQVGLGSSAAVTAAVTAALQSWCRQRLQTDELFAACLRIIHAVQGTGSGADAAASIYGGLVLYRMDPLLIIPIAAAPPLTVVYCGYKTPTVQVIDKVQSLQRNHAELYQHLYGTMDLLSMAAESAIRAHDWAKLGTLLNVNQGLLNAIGVSNADLEEIIERLRRDENIYGAKISGSGLGDCIISLGTASQQTVQGFQLPRQVLPLAVSPTGIEVA